MMPCLAVVFVTLMLDETRAADTVTLRDGKIVSGELLEPASAGSVGFQVRRAWVREHLPEWTDRWEAAEGPQNRRALASRRQRLETWRRDRLAAPKMQDDRITPWIDRELARLGDEAAARPPLLLLRLSRGDVKSVARAPKGSGRLLRLGWLNGFPNPESLSLDDLKGALEGRGLDLDSKAPVSIDTLLAPKIETDAAWLTRRAATEVSYDPGLRLIRHQGLVLPESEPGQAVNPETINAGLSALKNLLGENPDDPLPGRLQEIASRGRVGALVTRLDVSADMSVVTVEMALWVHQGRDRWTVAGSRSARVRPDDLGPDAGKELADDPRVAQAFQLVEGLGFGQAVQEVKQRGLAVGAATRKALGQARSLANDDLNRLAFPVLDAPRDRDQPPPRDKK